jgi:N-acetylglucosamine-6-phosphate deacetylase
MAAAGAPPGKYRIGRLQLEVGADQIVRLPGTPNFAGSALRPVDGIGRAAEMLGCGWQSVWERFSTAPARFMGLPGGEIKGGEPATFCLVQTTGEQIEAVRTFVRGVEQQ